MGGGPDAQILGPGPVLPVVPGAKRRVRREVGRLVGREPAVRQRFVRDPEQRARVFRTGGEVLAAGRAAAEGRSRFDGQLVGRDVRHSGKRRRSPEFRPQRTRRLSGGSVDEVQRDPGNPGFGEPGGGGPDIGRGVRAAEEPQPGVVERLRAEADPGDPFSGPATGEVRVADEVFGVRLDDDEGRRERRRERRRRGESAGDRAGGDLREEPRGSERGRPAAEVHRVGAQRCGAQFQFPEQRGPVTLEPAVSVAAERGDREVAVGADSGTEGDVDIEPRSRRVLVGGRRGIRRPAHAAGLDFSTATKAAWGICTFPTCFMRFLPSFWRSSSFRFRVMSPP